MEKYDVENIIRSIDHNAEYIAKSICWSICIVSVILFLGLSLGLNDQLHKINSKLGDIYDTSIATCEQLNQQIFQEQLKTDPVLRNEINSIPTTGESLPLQEINLNKDFIGLCHPRNN